MSRQHSITPRFRRFVGFLAGLASLLGLLAGSSVAHAAIVERGADEHAQTAHEFARHSQSATKADAGAAKAWGADAGSSDAAHPRSVAPMVSLPVPAAIWMFGSGLAALGLARRRISAWRRRDRRRAMRNVRGPRKPPRPQPRATLRERACRRLASGGHGGDSSEMPERMASHRDDGEGDGSTTSRATASDQAETRFSELAAALVEQPDVVLGRAFGMSCVKHGKRAFLVLDQGVRGGLAFRLGEQGAARLLAAMPALENWNPKQERQPKRSWVICRGGSGEALVRLAVEAYEWTLRETTASDPASGSTQDELVSTGSSEPFRGLVS